ncbi:serine hydrolase domain-containing protein [Bacillus sp. AFS088145]|uniref:serine hydrolase domain-containing protein n=1 Tax=Bacillus sp. AFS088145 TaxID=2033514 RepID=UPI000BFA5CFB|nr:serine hydrolase domain-containing protein [Bacillus sp. AFS088145]PFH86992.1 penicillin-binding protein [Bacillus sp. AFS088145]
MERIEKKIEKIDILLKEISGEITVGISISIVKDDRIVYSKGFGYSQLEPDLKSIDENTIMSIQSVSKNFVATCIMQLVETGFIRLDEPLVNYLPYFRTKDKKLSDQITVRHVLSHTAGFPFDLGIANLVAPNVKEIYSDTPTEWSEALAHYNLSEQEITSIQSREDLTRWFSKVDLEYPPGDGWNYCTDAYVILGDLIEKLTGESWECYLLKNVINPLNMRRTKWDSSKVIGDSNYSKYYLEYEKKETPYPTNPVAAPIGFLYSTANDLATYMLFQLSYPSKKILDSSYKKQMQNPGILVSEPWNNENNTRYYGLGWFIEKYKGKTIVEHGGGQLAVRALLSLVPEERLGVTVLLNFDSNIHRIISRRIIDIMLGI